MIGRIGLAVWGAVRASRYLQIGLIGLLGLGGFKGWLHVHDRGTAKQVAAQIGHASTKLAEKGGAARGAAAVPGSVERLRAKVYHYECQIGTAERAGKVSFDAEKFLAKQK